jgi:hypothetical protein
MFWTHNNIKIFEKLEQSGEESSNVWNNAGTGHSALCELNYTAECPVPALFQTFELSSPDCSNFSNILISLSGDNSFCTLWIELY